MLKTTLCITSLLLATGARAQDYTVVPDAFIYCTTCHGVELKGNQSVAAPRLNGMEGWYIRNQLNAFKSGWRGHHPLDTAGMEMLPQAALLDAERIEDAAAFVASVPRREDDQPTITGNVDRGASVYATCRACHGDRAQGNQTLSAPALAGQSDWYLARQLRNYIAGARGTAAGDTLGAQMRASTIPLTDETAIDDVVSYIKTLR